MTTQLSKKYQKKTDKQHILDAPDTYIGSVEEDTIHDWMYNEDKMSYEDYTWIPGLYKCFDEGIVNARDHYVRMLSSSTPVKYIKVSIDDETIHIENDGQGIDVEKHPEYNLWIPEMIFGHLRTSTNYDKKEKKIVGGKNGFGFKLVLIYSKWGKIETVDSTRKLKYTQVFRNNLDIIEPPKITKCSKKPYTKVSFQPDFKRFGINTNKFPEDMKKLIRKRTIDIGAITTKDVKVYFNGIQTPFKTFEQYIKHYVPKYVYERGNQRWEYAVALTPLDEFTQVSFVNGIYTSKGGKHVDYILNQIIKKLVSYIETKKKVKVKPTTLKEQLMIFVNCVIENPSFDSQTKETMNTKITNFGSSVNVSDKFIQKIIRLGVVDTALSLTDIKTHKSMQKTDGKKTKTIKGIPKLVDANYAGTSKSNQCTLILCEGDSAKSGVMSGLSKEDRNYMGVYPLKGKFINVKDCSLSRLQQNQELNDLKKIIGLQINKTYEDDISSLRYGSILCLTDFDKDGHHIKGLIINLFQTLWPSLFKRKNFIRFMNTPILKVFKGQQVISFYHEDNYHQWKETTPQSDKWKVKYYKGLGTSTSKEFKEYFKEKKFMTCVYDTPEDESCIDMVFNKKRADDRKQWLSQYDKSVTLNYDNTELYYRDFINKELIHFSKYDNERSIPNIMDGLKTSLRKILYCAFKRNLKQEVKVAQFSGYVSEHSGYHHGEMSLNTAIIGMAQNFVGSNNINLLQPLGQFGTRLKGGTDSAAERYIFTKLNPIVSYIYRKEDSPILNYLNDDGDLVEPEFYVPIIPMILVNGSIGIGTGYSTNVLPYNPKVIIEYISCKLKDKLPFHIEFKPYYKGFKGDTVKINDHTWMFKGKWEKLKSNVIRITELPIKVWTEKYKEFLEILRDGTEKKKSIIKDYKDECTDTQIQFTITFYNPEQLQELIDTMISVKFDTKITKLEYVLNLYSIQTTNNMTLFNSKQQLKKYKDVQEIIDEYIPIRLEYYEKRKQYLLDIYKKELKILKNRKRFIEEQLLDDNDKHHLSLKRKTKDNVYTELEQRGYDKIENTYSYLTSMKMELFMEEYIQELIMKTEEKEHQLNELKDTTIYQLWLRELEELNEKL